MRNMACSLLLAGLIYLTAACQVCTGQTYSGIADTDLQGLQALNASISNFADVAASPGFTGWTDNNPCPGANGVPWVGITCDYTVTPYRVTVLDLAVLSPGLVQGTLPAALGNLTAATAVILQAQNFTGPLPAAWGTNGSFTSLQALILSQNSLTGNLPTWNSTTRFQQLQTLNLFNNSFSGTLPPSWPQAFPSLTNLVLDNNTLSGQLPVQWGGSFTSLLQLSVLNNRITGRLPPNWAFDSLSTLQVNGNQLTGPLPELYPTTLPVLQTLDVSDNALTGPIPQTWANWTSLTTLIIFPGNSGICGELSPELLMSPDGIGQRLYPSETAGLRNASDGGILLSSCISSVPAPAPLANSRVAAVGVSAG